jgi:rRNA-processing protein FCF1
MDQRQASPIDSSIIDYILKTPGLIERIRQAAAGDILTLVETHILKDQLENTEEESRREQLLAVYGALPKTQVETSGLILDVSRLDMAELGGNAVSESISRLRPSKDLGGLKDALLAATASGKADVLVTNDRDLRKKAARESIQVWGFEQFSKFVTEAVR